MMIRSVEASLSIADICSRLRDLSSKSSETLSFLNSCDEKARNANIFLSAATFETPHPWVFLSSLCSRLLLLSFFFCVCGLHLFLRLGSRFLFTFVSFSILFYWLIFACRYLPNMNMSKFFDFSGASRIILRFDDACFTEYGSDRLTLYSDASMNHPLGHSFSGSGSEFPSKLILENDTLCMHFISDPSVEYWGVRLVSWSPFFIAMLFLSFF